ncbi:hypothetical protein OUZ56_011353 [Daphnia magna]|uniref:Uncharacterized protein n=1 Tax=Daphnia magna TaxID=35525 RepID=A0ABQ9Z0A3_9CRUS|nr:hypothetical protein OUZ56_011353 [Daphnia magna]
MFQNLNVYIYVLNNIHATHIIKSSAAGDGVVMMPLLMPRDLKRIKDLVGLYQLNDEMEKIISGWND